MSKKIELATAISAILIALASLMFTYYQFTVLVDHNKISATPYLKFWVKKDNQDKSYSLRIKNTGLGPARITNFDVIYNDNKFHFPKKNDWKKIIQLMGKYAITGYITNDTFSKNEVLGAGDETELFKFKSHGKDPDIMIRLFLSSELAKIQKLESTEQQKETNFKKLIARLVPLDLVIEYESLYKDKMPPLSSRD
ncbi:MAG: hypothetical protein HRT95_19665 [Moritella sp.]|uniref:hypothetical protein n=1 Tax=Moritella sp. TaxID=78556 RepID=UPI001E1AC181|nr:hypothetical protein [Moritella sp.]NQZ52303.1 hypothetical protein [Moritella sp.]